MLPLHMTLCGVMSNVSLGFVLLKRAVCSGALSLQPELSVVFSHRCVKKVEDAFSLHLAIWHGRSVRESSLKTRQKVLGIIGVFVRGLSDAPQSSRDLGLLQGDLRPRTFSFLRLFSSPSFIKRHQDRNRKSFLPSAIRLYNSSGATQ